MAASRLLVARPRPATPMGAGLQQMRQGQMRELLRR